MAFTVSPQTARASAPGASDDSTQGFVIGSMWVDTSTAPDTLYVCTSAAAGAAPWITAAGTTDHSLLDSISLGWAASGHTGTTNSVACFNGAGAALNVQATVEGTVLTFTGGVLTFASFAGTVAYLSDKAFEINYNLGFTDAASSAFVLAGTMV
jgi:hypothetical protein